jgi:pimeloyl-ACP methyl ester carboxylesterase
VADEGVPQVELLYRHCVFDVAGIERPVLLWQGLDDRLALHPIDKAVADAVPGSVWHPADGAGHFLAVGESADIFAVVAQDLGA